MGKEVPCVFAPAVCAAARTSLPTNTSTLVKYLNFVGKVQLDNSLLFDIYLFKLLSY